MRYKNKYVSIQCMYVYNGTKKKNIIYVTIILILFILNKGMSIFFFETRKNVFDLFKINKLYANSSLSSSDLKSAVLKVKC